MIPEMIEMAAKNLIGMRRVMSLAEDRTPELWQHFMPRRAAVKARVDDRYLSVRVYRETGPHMFDPQTRFEKWAAVEVSRLDPVPAGMEPLTLPAGRYAVFEHRGPASTFGETMGHIFGTWLPSSGFGLDHRPHFEVLPADYRPDDADARERVWVPVI